MDTIHYSRFRLPLLYHRDVRTMKKLILIALITFSFPLALVAGGSFDLEKDLIPILNQKPDLKKTIFDSFDLHWTGGAGRIGLRVNERLGGKRIGPYYLKAKSKGSKSDFNLTIVFHTKVIFKDKNGKETSLPKAYTVEEIFYSFEVLPLNQESVIWLEKPKY